MLTICIITKNESEKLSRLIDSVAQLGFDIAVTDTGSDDDTLLMLENAKKNYAGVCNIKISHFNWTDDFAAAKNFAASMADTEQVLILDSDEWLDCEEAKKPDLRDSLISIIKKNITKIGRIRCRNIISLEGEEQTGTELVSRIYSKKLFRFEGAIHEQLVPAEGDSGENYETYITPLTINHDGYAGTEERKREKAIRNISLLSKELEKSGYQAKKEAGELPDDYYKTEKQVPYILYQMGKSYYMMGDHASAADHLGEALFFDLDERLEYVADMVETYGYALTNSGRAAEALALEGVYDAFGESADFNFLMGVIYMENSKFDAAIELFERAASMENGRVKGVDSYLPLYNCGVICEVLGDRTRAKDYYARALPYKKASTGLARLSAEKGSFLVILGVRYCYNVLNDILLGIVSTLKKMGYTVDTYDEQEGGAAGLSAFVGKKYDGIFAVQTYLYGIYLESRKKFLFDEITGPKYNIILDHPGWLSHLFERLPEDTFVLTHDRDYLDFTKRYYGALSGSYFFPLASAPSGRSIRPASERKYDLIFIGTYGDYRKKLAQIAETGNSFVKFLANRYLLIMRKNTKLSAEEAFRNALEYYGRECDDDTFLSLFSAMNPVLSCVMYYTRERVVRELLKHGVKLDIWGETWNDSPLRDDKYLRIHPEVTPEESQLIMEDAKLSLNIMAWHKGGFTERMARSMFSGAVLVTDETKYFADHDSSGVEQFDLNDIASLAGRTEHLLSSPDELNEMACAGYENAIKNHTWEKRLSELFEVRG